MAARFAVNELGAKTAAILYDQGNDYTVGLSKAFKEEFVKLGGQVLVEETYAEGDKDFSAVLTTVAEKNPDILYLPDYYNKVSVIGQQARDKGIKAAFLGGDGWDSTDLNFEVMAGGYFTAHYSKEEPREAVKSWVEMFKAKYGSAPDSFATLGYDATKLLLKAIENANSSDPAKIREALQAIKDFPVVHSLTARLFSDLRLVLFDTTSVYFEGRGPEVLASYGYSRDRRPDRRQFILGLLTSREGLPIAHVVLPGSTSDLKALQTALQSLVEKLPVTEVITVMDRGMVSDENLRELQEAGIQYIVGAKLRHLKTRQALAIAGRYQVVADNLRVKEVKLEEDRRHIICYNPIEAERDREQREAMVAYLEDKLSQGVKGLLKNGVARRYLRIKGSKVSLDREKIKNDAQYDGKWVLLTTTSLPDEEVALSYKGLW
ncbi:MAG: IS1634 family transposase [Desulfotomaculales bacterium]